MYFLFAQTLKLLQISIVIGPESDHWECLSLTPSLTHCCLVNLIDVTLACEVDNLKLVEVVTVAHVDDEKHVDNSLVKVCSLMIKSSFCSDFGHKYSRFGQNIEVDVQARF